MPKAIVPREVIVHGNVRWRVIVPKDLRRDGQAFHFFDDRDKAVKKAAELANERGRIGSGFLALTQQSQALVLEALRRVDGDAAKLLAAVERMNTAEKALKPKLIGVVVDEHLAVKKAIGIRNHSYKNIKSSLGKFSAAMTVETLDLVTPELLEKWVNGNNWLPASRKTYLGHVAGLFVFARRRGYVTSNPAESVARPRYEDKPPSIHTPKQVKEVMDWCKKNDRALIGYLAPVYFGGLRPNESAQLNRAEIHDGLIEVTPQKSKTRRRRFVPVGETLKAWLKVRGMKLGGQWAAMTLRRHLRKMQAAVGFDFPHDVLRHSFCSYSLPKYGATKTAEWAGHSEQILFAHYRERVKPSDAERYWQVVP